MAGEGNVIYYEQAVGGLLAQRPVSAAERSPFQPGQGKLPPYLAGRSSEQGLIRKFLDVLAERDAPASDIILYGPRGNGKTALLLWARREAEALGIDVLRFSGATVPSLESLVSQTSAMPRLLRWLGGLSAPWVGGVKFRARARRQVRAILERRARKRPTLLAVDEAHRLGAEAGAVLLNAVQDVRGEELPAMLILAGTPDLSRHLNSMGASFWGRSKRLPVGRLDSAAAADAVRVPLAEHSRAIDEDALALVVRESHAYPFFLQLWGELLWEGAKDPTRPVSAADIERARPMFVAARGLYYEDRYSELKKAGLIEVAQEVAASFVNSERRLPAEVEQTVSTALRRLGRAADSSAIDAACDRLRDLGYIWSVVEDDVIRYEPGIPSLMRFLSRNPAVKTSLETS